MTQVSAKDLHTAITQASRCLNLNAPSQEGWELLRITTEQDCLKIANAYHRHVEVELWIPCQVEEHVDISLPYKMLASFLSKIQGDIQLSQENSQKDGELDTYLLITREAGRHKIGGTSLCDTHEPDRSEVNHSINVSTEWVLSGRQISFAAAKDAGGFEEIRKIFVCFFGEAGWEMAATNSHRLSVARCFQEDEQETKEAEFSLLLNREIFFALSAEPLQIQVTHRGSIHMYGENLHIAQHHNESARFPNYRRILSAKNDSYFSIVCNRRALQHANSIAQTMASRGHGITRLEVSDRGEFCLKGDGEEMGHIVEKVPTEDISSFQDSTLEIQGKYFQEPLEKIEGEEVELYLYPLQKGENTGKKPIFLEGEGAKGVHTLHLIVPLAR